MWSFYLATTSITNMHQCDALFDYDAFHLTTTVNRSRCRNPNSYRINDRVCKRIVSFVLAAVQTPFLCIMATCTILRRIKTLSERMTQHIRLIVFLMKLWSYRLHRFHFKIRCLNEKLVKIHMFDWCNQSIIVMIDQKLERLN